MFAYCGNNPVMGNDPTGELNWGKLFSGASLLAVGITVCAAALTVVTAGACTPLLVAACATFDSGAVTVYVMIFATHSISILIYRHR